MSEKERIHPDVRRIVGTLATYTWNQEGQVFMVREGKNFIGRGDVTSEKERYPCDIQIPYDTMLSAVHAVIICSARGIKIFDQDTTNATFVNGFKLKPYSHEGIELPNNSEIKTGATVWTFTTMGGAPTISNVREPNPVFISYDREDQGFAKRLRNELESHGVDTWMDDLELGVGEDWLDRIAETLEKASAVVVILSPDSLKSRWVKREIRFADDKHLPVFPILPSTCELPSWFEFQFGHLQRLDFTQGSFTMNVDRLRESVKRIRSL